MTLIHKLKVLIPVAMITAILGLSACAGTGGSYPGQTNQGGGGHGGHSH